MQYYEYFGLYGGIVLSVAGAVMLLISALSDSNAYVYLAIFAITEPLAVLVASQILQVYQDAQLYYVNTVKTVIAYEKVEVIVEPPIVEPEPPVVVPVVPEPVEPEPVEPG